MKPISAFFIGVGLGLVLLGIAALFVPKVHAADLPLPKPRPAAAVIPVMPPERCLVTGENPDPGQTLHVDKRCKSGLRWVYQR